VTVHPDIKAFNEALDKGDREICEALTSHIDQHLREATSKMACTVFSP
jgi:hypothetical protein